MECRSIERAKDLFNMTGMGFPCACRVDHVMGDSAQIPQVKRYWRALAEARVIPPCFCLLAIAVFLDTWGA
jgi:hypothetical protein